MHGPKGVLLNTLSHLALVALVSSVTSLAHADTSYSADFSLEGGWLPALRTGSPAWDGADSLPGAWTGRSNFDAIVNSRDLLSSTVNPATGAVENTWGEQNHDANMHRAGGPPLAMGDTHAKILGPNDWSHTRAHSEVWWSRLSADVTTTDRPADADARATFSREFSLDAHSSFTFSGIASLDITGDANPLATTTTFDSNASFASLTLGDLFGRVRTTIGASIWGITSGLSNIFSYSVGANGLLALTITNNSDSALLGSVNAGAFVDVTPSPVSTSSAFSIAAPVPEPESWLLLLAGAGIAGFTAKKRKASDAVTALPA